MTGEGELWADRMLKRLIEQYWVVYYIVYVVAVVTIVVLQWGKLQADPDPIFRLAAIFGVSAGIASFLAILSEVFGRMVLLIPDAVKKLRASGKAEGLVEGRKEERERMRKILEQVGDDVPPEDVLEKLKSELSGPDSEE